MNGSWCFLGTSNFICHFIETKGLPKYFLNLLSICFEKRFKRLVHILKFPSLHWQDKTSVSKSLNFIIGNKHSLVFLLITVLALLIVEKMASRHPSPKNRFVILSSKHGSMRKAADLDHGLFVLALCFKMTIRVQRKLPILSRIILKRHTYTQRLNLNKIDTFYSFTKDILQGIVFWLVGWWLVFQLEPVVLKNVIAAAARALWSHLIPTERLAVSLHVAFVSSVQMPTQ